jgi:hypothetical protein
MCSTHSHPFQKKHRAKQGINKTFKKACPYNFLKPSPLPGKIPKLGWPAASREISSELLEQFVIHLQAFPLGSQLFHRHPDGLPCKSTGMFTQNHASCHDFMTKGCG